MKKVKGLFYAGTSGLVTAIPQRDFPPGHEGKSRLSFYALLLNSIEINSSFYKLPKASTVSGWSQMVPPDFRFTFKLWKSITHEKRLAFQNGYVERNFGIIDQIGDKKGAVLVQFPPSLKIDALPQLENLLGVIAEVNTGWKIAVEFRHASWYHEDVYELIRSAEATLVYHDKGGSATPLVEPASDFVYQRFHGPGGDYKGSYDDGFLYEYSLYIQEWREEGRTVYVYFNNTAGEALKNLNLLKHYVDDN
jgi:uncharacterized protein YecE (DUF72 family)